MPDQDLPEQLQGVRQTQDQPLFPTGIGQLAAGLAGFGAGFSGRPNPVVEQALEQRRIQLDQQFRQTVLAIRLKQAVEAQRFQRDKLAVDILHGFLDSPTQEGRKFAVKGISDLLKKQGVEIPPTVLPALAQKKLSKEDLKNSLIFAAAGVDPPVIQGAFPGLQQIGGVGVLGQIARSDVGLKMLGLPTQQELAKQAQELRLKERTAATGERRADLEEKGLTLREADLAERRKERLGAIQPGRFVNKTTGDVRGLSKGELQANPMAFKQISPADETTLDFLKTAEPIFARLQELTPRLLQKHPVKNLVRALELRAQGISAANEDLREFSNLVEEGNIELTRALGGSGQFRVSLLNVLRAAVGASTRDTIGTAMRTIQTTRTSIENRKRSITGQQLLQFGQVIGPGVWTVKNRQTGQIKGVKLGPGDPLEPPWEALQYLGPEIPGTSQ